TPQARIAPPVYGTTRTLALGRYAAYRDGEATARGGAGAGDPAGGGRGAVGVRVRGHDHGQGRPPGRHQQERHLPPLAEPAGPPAAGDLRGEALALLRRANATWSSPTGAILRELLAAASAEPELLDRLRDRAGAGRLSAAWVEVLERAVARGEAPPAAVHP